jgi:excisionase family DNA binding protein
VEQNTLRADVLATDGAMTILDAARWLGISRSRLYELIDENAISTCRIGRRRLVSRSALRRYLSDRFSESDAA